MASQTFIQGQTGMDPNTQDFMRLQDQYYANNLASLSNQFQMEQVKKVAGYGAERLAQLGPQGQWWAQRLQQDPVGTYDMAEKMGGFQYIEDMLRRSAAVGSEVEAGVNKMTPTEFEAYRSGGPEGLAKMGDASANFAIAGQRRATADVMRSLMEGNMPGGGGYGGGDLGTENADLGSISALGFVMPEVARVQLAVREAARKPQREAIADIQAIAKPQIANMKQLAEDWRFVRNADFIQNPATDAWLTKLFVRAVEPGLMVSQQESGEVAIAATSDIGNIGMRILRTLTPEGRFTPTTRRMMAEAIDGSFRARAEEQMRFIQGLSQEAAPILGSSMNIQRAILGEDAPMATLHEFLNTPYDFNAIGPDFRDEPNRGVPESKPPIPPGPLVHKGKKYEAQWDPDTGRFYYDVED